MPDFITDSFLEQTKTAGRLIEALERLAALSAEETTLLPRLPELSLWECVLEEVLDTDHEPPYYDRFVNELLCRGYSLPEILEMRMIAWETAGWLNYEMMLWDWCHLDEDDMFRGLQHRCDSGNITAQRRDELAAAIERYREAPQGQPDEIHRKDNRNLQRTVYHPDPALSADQQIGSYGLESVPCQYGFHTGADCRGCQPHFKAR